MNKFTLTLAIAASSFFCLAATAQTAPPPVSGDASAADADVSAPTDETMPMDAETDGPQMGRDGMMNSGKRWRDKHGKMERGDHGKMMMMRPRGASIEIEMGKDNKIAVECGDTPIKACVDAIAPLMSRPAKP